jgi:hypothetical protein
MSTPRRRMPGWPPILSFSASHCSGGSHGPRSRPNTILVQAKPDMAQAQVRLPACPLQPHHPFVRRGKVARALYSTASSSPYPSSSPVC